MARISFVPVEEWPDELRTLLDADNRTELERGVARMRAHVPEFAIAYARLQATMADAARLDVRLRELVRLRIAFHNQCRSCMAIRYASAIDAGFDEDLVCSLEKPQESPDLTAAEKAALNYADKLSVDHWSISDEDFDRLKEHFTEAEIMELGMLCASWIGFGRLAMSLDMVEELPEGFTESATGSTTPWQAEPVVLR